MKFTYIIFLICITWCLGNEDEGKRISSSYTYSIEYNDSDHGNFGHKIEVKDGTAKVNVRSENAKNLNSAVASKPGKPYLPQKKPVIYSKPKGELAYVSAPESSTVVPVFKSSQPYSAPQVQSPKNAAVEAALKKYSQAQLAILLSQNKNPFLPIDPKDSINKFFSQYSTPQSGHAQNVPQTQSNTAYAPPTQSNNYLTQYQSQPAVSTDSKSQYPTTYYTPSVPQQNSQVQQSYYQPQVQQSYQPASYPSHSSVPQTQSVPTPQGPVQYVYVPQTPSHPVSSPQSTVSSHLPAASYGNTQSGAVQFAQQSYQPVTPKQEYVPSTAAYQSEQLTSSYPGYSSANQPNAYANVYASTVSSNGVQTKQQYVSSSYQNNQATYTIPKAASQVSQPSYQNVYGSSLPSQYPAAVSSPSYGSSSNIAAYKPVGEGAPQFSQGNFDFSKYAQYTPTSNQVSPAVAYKPSETGVPSSSNAAQYYSGSPQTAQTSGGNFDFSKYAQYTPASNQASPAVAYKPSETGVPSSSNAAQYYSGSPQTAQTSGGNFDFSKYAQYTPASNQASPAVAYKPSETRFPSSSNAAQYFAGLPKTAEGNFDFSKYAQSVPATNQASPAVTYIPSGAGVQSSSDAANYFSGLPQTSGGSFDFSKYAQYAPTSNQAASAGVPSSSNAAPHFSGFPQASAGNFDFSKYAQYTPAPNQASPAVTYKPAETGPQPSANSAQYFSGLPTTSGATQYPVGSTGQDATKSNIFGSNAGHNLFAGLQSSQNYGSLFSGASGTTVQDSAKYNVQPQAASPYGSSYPQFGNSAIPTANYKPVVENPTSDTSAKLQYQSPNVNSFLGSGIDISKFQSPALPNTQSNFNVPSGHNFNLNQISNVQATDNKYGQYAIDIRQGTSPSGAAVMVQTNYNLGAQNAQHSHSPSSASAASDNSNVKYVYVPSYTPNAPSSPNGANHGK